MRVRRKGAVNMGRLDGKICLVTGGGQGLGEAIARSFVSEGASVVVSSRSADKCAAVAKSLGPACVPFPFDVTDVDAWDAAVECAHEVFGGLDVLVNNAGGAAFNHIEDFTHEQWHWNVDLNLNSVFYGVKAALPLLKESQNASIINVSSIAGHRVAQKLPAYAATKHAIIGLTKSLALDLAELGVRCNAVLPGAFETPLTDGLDRRQRHVAQQRMGLSWEMGNLAVFLASDESPFMTGAEIAIDGGELAGRIKY